MAGRSSGVLRCYEWTEATVYSGVRISIWVGNLGHYCSLVFTPGGSKEDERFYRGIDRKTRAFSHSGAVNNAESCRHHYTEPGPHADSPSSTDPDHDTDSKSDSPTNAGAVNNDRRGILLVRAGTHTILP